MKLNIGIVFKLNPEPALVLNSVLFLSFHSIKKNRHFKNLITGLLFIVIKRGAIICPFKHEIEIEEINLFSYLDKSLQKKDLYISCRVD